MIKNKKPVTPLTSPLHAVRKKNVAPPELIALQKLQKKLFRKKKSIVLKLPKPKKLFTPSLDGKYEGPNTENISSNGKHILFSL